MRGLLCFSSTYVHGVRRCSARFRAILLSNLLPYFVPCLSARILEGQGPGGFRIGNAVGLFTEPTQMIRCVICDRIFSICSGIASTLNPEPVFYEQLEPGDLVIV